MVYILLAEGFEEMEAIIPADLLRRAGAQVSFVGLEELAVTGGQGITLQADVTLEQVDTEAMRMLVIPGGQAGVENLQMNLFAMALVQTAFDSGCWLGAICAAPTILANLGILDRRPAICYPGMENEMGSAVVKKGQSVVVSGRVVTGEAAGAAFQFGLKLVEVLQGKAAAEQVRNAVHFRG